jgi:hypothetical protein
MQTFAPDWAKILNRQVFPFTDTNERTNHRLTCRMTDWSTRAVFEVRGLTLLHRVGTLWRCGDGLFSKYLPWQAMHFLQRSTHFSKTCCRPLITSKFLASSELPFHVWKNPEIALGEMWIEFCVRLGKSGSVEPHYNIHYTAHISPHAISGLFQPRKGSSEANLEVINGLQHESEKWVEHCKKCIAYQRRYFEKETVTAPPQSSNSE